MYLNQTENSLVQNFTDIVLMMFAKLFEMKTAAAQLFRVLISVCKL
jgi:hypothetical protein